MVSSYESQSDSVKTRLICHAHNRLPIFETVVWSNYILEKCFDRPLDKRLDNLLRLFLWLTRFAFDAQPMFRYLIKLRHVIKSKLFSPLYAFPDLTVLSSCQILKTEYRLIKGLCCELFCELITLVRLFCSPFTSLLIQELTRLHVVPLFLRISGSNN